MGKDISLPTLSRYSSWEIGSLPLSAAGFSCDLYSIIWAVYQLDAMIFTTSFKGLPMMTMLVSYQRPPQLQHLKCNSINPSIPYSAQIQKKEYSLVHVRVVDLKSPSGTCRHVQNFHSTPSHLVHALSKLLAGVDRPAI